jgi:hypothetical protein
VVQGEDSGFFLATGVSISTTSVSTLTGGVIATGWNSVLAGIVSDTCTTGGVTF